MSSYDPQNIFAKILRGEIPCIKLHEDEHTLAFMDIMPQTEGHALVIPKEPAVTLFELSDAAAAACMATVRKIGNAQKKGLGADGVVLMQLNGPGAGQTVPATDHVASAQGERERIIAVLAGVELAPLDDAVGQPVIRNIFQTCKI